jgi:hypothetical protein
MPLDVHQLVDDYTKTSLYRALHAEVMTRIVIANSKDVNDPHEVMKLRGKVEAYQEILSVGFLTMAAMRALQAAQSEEPEAPEKPADDPGWWILERHNDVVS